MLKKVATFLICLIAMWIGIFCGIMLIIFVSKVIHLEDPLIFGTVFFVMGLLMSLIGYRLTQPDFKKIYDDKPIFGKISTKIYSFFIFLGAGASFIYLSIAVFFD